MRDELLLRPGYNGFVTDFHNRRGLQEFHSHPELEFNLITAGSAWYMVGSRRFLLVPGTIIWLFPDQEHLLVDIDRGFRMWIAVLGVEAKLSLAGAHPQFETLGLNDCGAVRVRMLAQSDTEALSFLCKSLARAGGGMRPDTTATHATRFNHGVAYLFAEAWSLYRSGAPLQPGSDLSPVVAETLRRIAARGGRLRLYEAANDLHVSQSWLSRAFHRETGIRFTDYCNRIKLTLFQDLRDRRPGANISALALDAGFGSYAQFYRVYRREYGLGPADRQSASP